MTKHRKHLRQPKARIRLHIHAVSLSVFGLSERMAVHRDYDSIRNIEVTNIFASHTIILFIHWLFFWTPSIKLQKSRSIERDQLKCAPFISQFIYRKKLDLNDVHVHFLIRAQKHRSRHMYDVLIE